MTVGMFVLASAVTWYQITRKQYVEQKSTQAVLTRMRTTFQFLSEDLQASGYRGVRSRDPTFKIKRHMAVQVTHPLADAVLYPTDKRLVYGFGIHAHPMCTENGDVLVIYDIPKKRTFLGVDQKTAKDNVYTLTESGVRAGALVLVADYSQGDMFIANQIINHVIFHQCIGGNVTDELSKIYNIHDKTEVVELQRVMYYLKPLDNVQAYHQDKSVYGLYRKDLLLASSAQELVRGITAFTVQYGQWDPENKQLIYRNATQMERNALGRDWPCVLSVKIKIMVINELTKQEEPFEFEIALRNTPLSFL